MYTLPVFLHCPLLLSGFGFRIHTLLQGRLVLLSLKYDQTHHIYIWFLLRIGIFLLKQSPLCSWWTVLMYHLQIFLLRCHFFHHICIWWLCYLFHPYMYWFCCYHHTHMLYGFHLSASGFLLFLFHHTHCINMLFHFRLLC